MQIYGIFTEYPWKIMENEWKIIPFLSFSFLNLLPDDPFSRSFLRSFSEKIRKFRRKIENLVEFSRKSFLFIPFYSSSSSNHPDFML